jgi:hypothetical protein
MIRVAWCLVLLTLLFGGTAYAQRWEGCVANGVPVPTVYDYNALGPAFSNSGRIVINPTRMRSFSPNHQRFIYWHECGHVVLGHQDESASNEMDADCFALHSLMTAQNLTQREVARIAREISRFPGDSAHLPGPARAEHLLRCGAGGTPKCRYVTLSEQYADVEVEMQPRQVPCQHCTCNRSGCSCLHSSDLIDQPVLVPVTKTRVVTRQVCD